MLIRSSVLSSFSTPEINEIIPGPTLRQYSLAASSEFGKGKMQRKKMEVISDREEANTRKLLMKKEKLSIFSKFIIIILLI